jgi:hypothetical protein
MPIPRAAHWTHQTPGEVRKSITTSSARMAGPTKRNFTARNVWNMVASSFSTPYETVEGFVATPLSNPDAAAIGGQSSASSCCKKARIDGGWIHTWRSTTMPS